MLVHVTVTMATTSVMQFCLEAQPVLQCEYVCKKFSLPLELRRQATTLPHYARLKGGGSLCPVEGGGGVAALDAHFSRRNMESALAYLSAFSLLAEVSKPSRKVSTTTCGAASGSGPQKS